MWRTILHRAWRPANCPATIDVHLITTPWIPYVRRQRNRLTPTQMIISHVCALANINIMSRMLSLNDTLQMLDVVVGR